MTAWIIFVSIAGPFYLCTFGWFLIRLVRRIDKGIEKADRDIEQADIRIEQDKQFKPLRKDMKEGYERHDKKFEALRKDMEKLSIDHARLEGKLEGLIAVMQQQPAA